MLGRSAGSHASAARMKRRAGAVSVRGMRTSCVLMRPTTRSVRDAAKGVTPTNCRRTHGGGGRQAGGEDQPLHLGVLCRSPWALEPAASAMQTYIYTACMLACHANKRVHVASIPSPRLADIFPQRVLQPESAWHP